MAAFKYNPNTDYKVGGVYKKQLIDKNLIHLVITVAPNKFFFANFPNIWKTYTLPAIISEDTVTDWTNNPMQFWQNQLNFVMWCATAGCGVAYKDHLKDTIGESLLQDIYIFHVYYTSMKLLFEMGVPLPTDKVFDPISNIYDKTTYEKLCVEFNVDPLTDWKQKVDTAGDGIGYAHTEGHTIRDRTGTELYSKTYKYVISKLDFSKMTFGPEVPGELHTPFLAPSYYAPPVKQHIVNILQGPKVYNAWSTFVLDKSDGFTQAGVGRLNDTIRTYVYAILGSQTRTRSRIVDQGTSFGTQKEFLNIISETINTVTSIATSIQLYQGILQHARGQVNYVFGQNLYMAPSNMILQIDSNMAGYNNKIVIASSDLSIGLNSHINDNLIIVPTPNGSFPVNSQTLEKVNKPQSFDPPHKPIPIIDNDLEEDNHESDKTALIVGCIIVGTALIWGLT